MNPSPQKKMLLNIAIVLLIVLNGLQVVGIVSHSASSTVSTSKSVDDTTRVTVQINVLNGCGVNGVGITMTKFCRKSGYDVVEMGNYKSFDIEHSMVIDRNGKMADALQLAAAIGIDKKYVVQQFSSDQMVSASVVIGKDYQSLQPWKK